MSPNRVSPPLDLVPAQPEFLPWGAYEIAFYRSGPVNAQPILFVHSINAAASSFEMREPFVRMRDRFAVHTVDLLGYGNSDRPNREYRAEDYIAQITLCLEQIGRPAVLVASSLSGAYAIVAAARRPELVSHLSLICPTGISQLSWPAGPVARWFHRLLRGQFGAAFFAALTSRWGTRYFLRQQAYASDSSITPEIAESFYRTTKHPGARFAPICFVTGLLNCDARAEWASLRMPLQLIWGRQAGTTPVGIAGEFLGSNPRAKFSVIERASLLVQGEQPQAFVNTLTAFIET